MASILTGIKNIISRKRLISDEELQREDLLRKNHNKLEDLSQRQGLLINSGLSEAEKQYILSDSIISAAIQMYIADISNICSKTSCIISSTVEYSEENSELALKEEKVRYIFNRVFNSELVDAIIINLLDNGEIFIDTKYNKGLNQYFVNESSFSRCTQLCYTNGETATFIVSNEPTNSNNQYTYNYNLNNTRNEFVDPEYMVRIYNPSLSNAKICIELDSNNENDADIVSKIGGNSSIYYSSSLSLLKQVYSDWLNSKLLELAVYRERIAKSRFIQLIAIELGRTSKITSDQIYDNVKEYFDKRAVIDLEQQTFKSVVGNEPFMDYKVYTTRNGNGKLTFDNSLNGSDANLSSLADLDYNLNKVYAGLGIPKQYLGADDNGSSLSNGTSLFFIDEKYQKRVTSYVRRIARGYKQIIKNLIVQQEGKDFFDKWDFDLTFTVPESNEDVMRVKNAKLDYINSVLELVDKLNGSEDYSVDNISEFLGEDLKKYMVNKDTTE